MEMELIPMQPLVCPPKMNQWMQVLMNRMVTKILLYDSFIQSDMPTDTGAILIFRSGTGYCPRGRHPIPLDLMNA